MGFNRSGGAWRWSSTHTLNTIPTSFSDSHHSCTVPLHHFPHHSEIIPSFPHHSYIPIPVPCRHSTSTPIPNPHRSSCHINHSTPFLHHPHTSSLIFPLIFSFPYHTIPALFSHHLCTIPLQFCIFGIN